MYHRHGNFLTTPILIGCLFTLLAFFRMSFVNTPFSFDYKTYLIIFEEIFDSNLGKIVTEKFIFPYIYLNNSIPIEFGFVFLVKFLSNFSENPQIIYAVISSISIGLRVYCMRAFGVPIFWIFLINIIIITLFEANAVRLGVASSIVLIGLINIYRDKKIWGLFYLILATNFQLQALLFTVPFSIFFFLTKFTKISNFTFFILLAVSVAIALAAPQFLVMLDNEKILFYVYEGSSSSAGLTITSTLALFLIIIMTVILTKKGKQIENLNFFRSVLVATVPSVMLLIFTTNVSVLGDRAWQMAYLVVATMFFPGWIKIDYKNILFCVLFVLTIIMIINVTFRFPLSNFFYPIFPDFAS